MNESSYTDPKQTDKNSVEIYFCAHHEDRELYFGTVYDALSKELECSLRYDGDPLFDSDNNKRKRQLERMSLFVVPVTNRLLKAESCAISEELPFARRNGIPVLPVLVEKIDGELLGDRFSEIFGNMQYLVLDQSDPASVCFNDRLKLFLASVLVSPELMTRLSLDKEEIEKLPVSEQKYLTGMAYYSGNGPQTDRNKAFELLKDAADSGNAEAMEQLSSFCRYGVGISSDSRERQMKYVLNCKERYEHEGTEKSAIRFADALEAQGNLEDAQKDLASMDKKTRDSRPIPRACLLMIALLEKTNEKYKTITTKRRLIAAYDSIRSQYAVTKKNGTAEAYGLLAIAILEDMAKYNYDTEIFENIAKRYHALGNEAGVSGEAALDHLQRAMVFYNKAKGKNRSPEALKGYISIFESISFCLLHRIGNKYDESRIISKKLLALQEELCEKEPLYENKLALCKQYLCFASPVSDSSRDRRLFSPEERIGFCDRAGELMDELFADEDKPSQIHYSLLLKHLSHTAQAYEDMKENERAAEYCLKYVLQLESPPSTIRNSELDREKAEAYLKLSDIFEKTGFEGRAAKCALKAVSFGTLGLEELCEFMTKYTKKKDPDTLSAFLSDGFDRYRELVSEDTAEMPEFAVVCCSAYEVCLKNGKPEAALEYLQSSVDACRAMAENEESRQGQLFLFRTLSMLGDLHLRFENRDAAIESYLECAATGDTIGDDELLVDELRILSGVYRQLASFSEEDGDLEAAEKYYTLALKRLYRIYLINDQRDELSAGIAPLTAIYKKQGNRFYVFKRSLALSRQIKKWDNE